MANGRGFIRTLSIAATFIILEVAALYLLKGSSSLQNTWFNRMSYQAVNVLWRHWGDVKTYFSLKDLASEQARENTELLKENARLKARLDELNSSVASPASVKGFRFIPAIVTKMSDNTQHNYFILDKGSIDGVKPQSGVITAKGVVGIVTAVDKHYSYGMSLLNNEVSVSARAGAEEMVAPLSWDGMHKGRALLRELPLHSGIEPGDTVWTSGFSTLFPAGIPIGIAGETKVINGSTNETEVFLLERLNDVRFVTVVDNIGAEEISRLEKEGRDKR